MKIFGHLGVVSALLLAAWMSQAAAQEVTLRLHQFLPAPATLPAKVLKPWAQELEAASGGRLKIEHFDGMSLGGTPPELMDQAIEGVADITMAVVGYTASRYPSSEVFELPFMMTNAEATSRAYWDLIESELQATEFRDVKVLAGWVHGPGAIHSSKPVRSLSDMEGQKLRAPTRMSNALVAELGATAIGMPLPAIPESLSKGVIDGTVIAWEVVPALKLNELVGYHTDFAGENGLYTTAIVLVMNQTSYEGLPDDLRAVLDANTGAELSARAGGMMEASDTAGRDAATASGNEIHVLSEDEVARWKEASLVIFDGWYEDMAKRGIDGPALVEKARGLIASHTK